MPYTSGRSALGERPIARQPPVQISGFRSRPEPGTLAHRLARILLGNDRTKYENARVRAHIARRRRASVAQALGERQFAGMRLAHRLSMPSDLPDDARELIGHFAELPDEDRARVLALVRGLSLCRTVELYRGVWAAPRLARPGPTRPPSQSSIPRGGRTTD